MKNVSPHNQNNAIKSVAFVFELDKEVNEETIVSVRKWYSESKEFKNFFTVEQPIQSVKIQMDGNNQQVTSSSVGGVNYLKIAEDGTTVEWSLRVDSKAITIACNLYTRWDEVWGVVLVNLEKIVAQMHGFSLTKIALEYLDEFNVFGTNNNEWLGQLFKEDSLFIPNFVHSMNAPWHTHNGFITDEKDKEVSRRTVNAVNITYQKTNISNDILAIQTQHASSFYSKFELSADSMKNIDTIMQYSHIENKKLFNNLLSSEMLNEIKLEV